MQSLASASPSWVLGFWPGTPYRTNSSSSHCFPCALRTLLIAQQLFVLMLISFLRLNMCWLLFTATPAAIPIHLLSSSALFGTLEALEGRHSGFLPDCFQWGSTLEGTLPPPPCNFPAFTESLSFAASLLPWTQTLLGAILISPAVQWDFVTLLPSPSSCGPVGDDFPLLPASEC